MPLRKSKTRTKITNAVARKRIKVKPRITTDKASAVNAVAAVVAADVETIVTTNAAVKTNAATIDAVMMTTVVNGIVTSAVAAVVAVMDTVVEVAKAEAEVTMIGNDMSVTIETPPATMNKIEEAADTVATMVDTIEIVTVTAVYLKELDSTITCRARSLSCAQTVDDNVVNATNGKHTLQEVGVVTKMTKMVMMTSTTRAVTRLPTAESEAYTEQQRPVLRVN